MTNGQPGFDYQKICFVIMPFGEKEVTDDQGKARKVNFDPIYDQIFYPAIRATALPEGGFLEPRRTDRDFFTADISSDMFAYLEYSRFALGDISGLNPNVFYELGVRHRARQSGTALFRLLAMKIPFDISQIKAFPYEYEPDEQVTKSRELVTRVLTESLRQNRLDSPVQKALLVQRTEHADIEGHLRAAEQAIRARLLPKAIAEYREAVKGDPRNNLLHLRLGLLLKDDGQWPQALEQFEQAIAAAPDYAEAHREKGIAQNKMFHKAGKPADMPDGIAALQRAVELNPEDYDAHASLGGALKRAGRLHEARLEYEKAVNVSRGHSYPLLNAITLAAHEVGKLELDDDQRFMLSRAERSLRAQVASDPPYDPPWSLFDFAQIRLFNGAKDEFLSYLTTGTELANAPWQPETFRDTLKLLADGGVDLPGLREGMDILEKRADSLR